MAPSIHVRLLNSTSRYFRKLARRALTRIVNTPGLSATELETVSAEFDDKFYLASYPDVEAAGIDPFTHYMELGWREGRDPSSKFGTNYYLLSNKELEFNRLNPFAHYILKGRNEGRSPLPGKVVQLRKSDKSEIITKPLLRIISSGRKSARPPPATDLNKDSLCIHWVIPDFEIGSGGHMTIFRMVRFLELAGHNCKIWIEEKYFHTNSRSAYDDIVKHFQCISAEVAFVDDGFFNAQGDVVIATVWSTAYTVDAASGFREKFYFVQDHEPEFYSTGVDAILAKHTYSLDLACICAGPWLKQKMSKKYGCWARSFDLAYDEETYKKAAAKPKRSGESNGLVKIAVYARTSTARRCVPLAVAALHILAQRSRNFEVHFFGVQNLRFASTNHLSYSHGVLSSEKLAQLYHDCDIGICFSGTNYSLVPKEMMACGLPVVELDGSNTRSIFPDNVVAFAGPNPFDIADKIEELINSPSKRRAQAAAASNWVSQFSWHKAGKDVERSIKERLQERHSDVFATPAILTPSEKSFDIVIPTYNGLTDIKETIAALRSQREIDRCQIYCVDSSSSDGTAEWLAQQRDVSLTTIPKEKFQHGETRNLGASLGTARLIAFLTQDARPVNRYWVTDYQMILRHYSRAAGAFGRHIGYWHHPTSIRRKIEDHFLSFLQHPLEVSKDTDPEAWAAPNRGWLQMLHFFSSNNSCLRRSVWEKIPFRSTDYGEDQLWAYDVIAAGHSKVYAPTAIVFHSHNYSPEDAYQRAKIEAKYFHRHFGYEVVSGAAGEGEQFVKTGLVRFNEAAGEKRAVAEIDIEEYKLAREYQGYLDGIQEAKLEKVIAEGSL
jgi:glycosyltransferase involved in cell wall biosynthesis/GT2 family glycosyltransferase